MDVDRHNNALAPMRYRKNIRKKRRLGHGTHFRVWVAENGVKVKT